MEPAVGGRAVAAPVGPVDTFPGTGGRTRGGRATDGPALGGRTVAVPAGLDGSARGTTRFVFGGSMLDDEGDDT